VVRCAAAAQRFHNNQMSPTESRSYHPAIRIHDICAEKGKIGSLTTTLSAEQIVRVREAIFFALAL
jgi:hypothetical protein